jgi:hypothetical protein
MYSYTHVSQSFANTAIFAGNITNKYIFGQLQQQSKIVAYPFIQFDRVR